VKVKFRLEAANARSPYVMIKHDMRNSSTRGARQSQVRISNEEE
jgi:hypothetical protein